MITEPYDPGPQGDDKPGLGCFKTIVTLVLAIAMLAIASFKTTVVGIGTVPPPPPTPTPTIVSPPVSETHCCQVWLPVVSVACGGAPLKRR